jgi:hypothetical protein
MENQQIQPKKKMLPVWELIENSWKFYKTNFRKLWLLFLLGGLGNMGARFSYSGSSSNSGNIFGHISILMWVVIIVVVLIVGVFLFLSKIALFKSISDVHKGQYIGIKDAYKKGMHLFWPFVLIQIIFSVVIFGSFALLIVPGIILYGYLLFSQIQFFDEDKRNFNALLGSWALVKNYWWAVVWRLIVISILIGLLCGLCIGIPLVATVILGILLAKISIAIGIILGAIVAIALLAFIFLFFEPFAIIILFQLYFNLKDVRGPNLAENAAIGLHRKRKLIALIIIAVLAIIPFYFVGKAIDQKILQWQKDATTMALPSNVIVPTHGSFTFENPSAEYTIDYPTSWVTNGQKITSPNYSNIVLFQPWSLVNTVSPNNSSTTAPQENIEIIAGSLPSNITTLDGEQKNILSILSSESNHLRQESVLGVSSTTVAGLPAAQINYIEQDVTTDPETGATTTDEFEGLVTLLIKGNYYYVLSYFNDKSAYDADLPVMQSMLNSWYLQYVQKIVGDSYQYDNPDYGIRMLYPKSWIQTDAVTPQAGDIAGFGSPDYDSQGIWTSTQSFGVNIVNYGGSLDSFENGFAHGNFIRGAQNFSVQQMTPISLLGNKGDLISYTYELDGQMLQRSVAVTIESGRKYEIIFNNLPSENPILQTAISSFELYQPSMVDLTVPATTSTNRQYGYSISVPTTWTDGGPDLVNSIVDGYALPVTASSSYSANFSISLVDDSNAFSSNPITVEEYRNQALAFWKKSSSYNDFNLVSIGTTTVDGYPAAYFVGSYLDNNQNDFKAGTVGFSEIPIYAKQTFVDRYGIIRWFSFIDDKNNFLELLPFTDNVIQTVQLR